MIKFLNTIRTPNTITSRLKALSHTMAIICIGLALGVIAKMLDIYTTNLGNIFSQMSVWIFLCTLISIHSSTPRRAAVNVFCFCGTMLATYYLTAVLTTSSYSTLFIYGWVIFSLFSPLMASCVWYAKGDNWISKIIAGSIIVVMLLVALLLFDKIRMADIIFVVLSSMVLLKKS